MIIPHRGASLLPSLVPWGGPQFNLKQLIWSIHMNQAIELIRQLACERFYGALTLKFEAGQVTTLKKEQTLKPADLSEKPRNQNDNSKNR
jgi:hypothetical protein